MIMTSFLVSLSFLELPSKLTVSSLVSPPLIGGNRKLELKTRMMKNPFILTGKKNIKGHAPVSGKRLSHPFESFDIELFHIELLSQIRGLLSLQFLGQFWPWEGVKSGKNNGLWLRNGCHKNTYRNHRIKNVVSKAIRAIQGWFNYLKKGVDNMLTIIKTYTKGIFAMVKQCQNFYKLRSESI